MSPSNIWIVGTAFWFLISAIADPQFGGTDVFVYKDAGVNWALGRGLAPSVRLWSRTSTKLRP
jgi:hypothetical protein